MAEEKESKEPKKDEKGQDGSFEISVSADKLHAELKVTPPVAPGKAVTVDALFQKISEMGLKNANRDAVSKYLSDGNFVQPMILAEGSAPVPGKDGRVEYLYLEKGGAKEDQFGSVDLRNVSAFKYAANGEKLVRNFPPVEGKDGCTVFGDAIPYLPGKNPAPVPGKNIEVTPDGTEYSATESGLVTLADNVISVDKVLKVDSDVDFKVGNINFDGAVMISGAIQGGFTVQATGDVMAQLVSQANVESGGNVVIEKGIIGAAGTSVKAVGDVRAKFVENAHIKAGGSVVVSEAIMHSDVSAGKHVVVRGGKHCNIIGGTIKVGGSVEATTIGAEVSSKTVLEVGYDPVSRARLEELETELAKQNENQEKVKVAVSTLNKLKAHAGAGVLPPDKESLLKKLMETSKTLEHEIQQFQKEHADLQSHLHHARPGTISAKDAIMPGTTVTILSETMKVNKKYSSTSFYLDMAQKKITPGSFTALEI